MSTATAPATRLPAAHPIFSEIARKCHTVGTAYAVVRTEGGDLSTEMFWDVVENGHESRLVEIVVAQGGDPESEQYTQFGVPVRVSRVRDPWSDWPRYYIAN